MSCTINIKEDYNEFSALKLLEHYFRNDDIYTRSNAFKKSTEIN